MNSKKTILQRLSKTKLSLNELPTQQKYHLLADYIEVISLFSNDNYVSTSDMIDRLKDQGLIRPTEKDEDKDRAALNDRHEIMINQVFQLIDDRTYLFGADYPFETLGGNKIRLRYKDGLSDRQKIYIFLLLASNLNIFSFFQDKLTSEFEKISHLVLVNFLPANAFVESFGKNTNLGNAIQKVRWLAEKLNLNIREEMLENISARNNQERGLDIVGWVPFDDAVANLLLILGQCACGKEWYDKGGETERYEQYCDFHRKEPMHSMFVPYALIDYQKSRFFQGDEIKKNTLFFERKRILNYVGGGEVINSLKSKLLVESCIEFIEDLY